MDTQLLSKIECELAQSAAAMTMLTASTRQIVDIRTVVEMLPKLFALGGRVLLCGNGGSAAMAQHLAAEFVGRFEMPGRGALPAIALTADSAVMTALANDFGYQQVFLRQVRALGRPQDMLIALSTSGRSDNVLWALRAARQMGMFCVGMAGRDGGMMHGLCDVLIQVPAVEAAQVQEMHLVVGHVICRLAERALVAACHRPATAAGG